MRRFIKLSAVIIISIILVCAISFFTDKNQVGKWKISTSQKDSIAWAKFYWAGGNLGEKYYEKYAMMIPAKMEHLPYTFSFQFDLGATYTEIYEHNFQSLIEKHPEFKEKEQRLKSPLQFWNSNKVLKDIAIDLGSFSIVTKNCLIHKNYGDRISFTNEKDTLHVGTIGADVFQNKVLIIDYPNQQFGICNSVPPGFTMPLVDIEIDGAGKPILPMTLRNKNYRISFDNGSSLFPLITLAKNINRFSSEPVIDTLKISSWGQFHNVNGRRIKDSFELAGQKFANVKIYSNESGLGIDPNTDGMAGNALFWNRVIMIDFKNKKFGVK